MGLQEQLDSFRAEFARTAPSGRVALYEARIEELRAHFALAKAVGTGDEAPDFSLPDARGNLVSLSELLQRGPVVVTFYRGGWCPYCNIQLRAYQAILSEIDALGARLVAISPQLPDGSLATAETNALTFDVVSDTGNSVARRFGLVYALPEDLREALRANNKALPAINGDGSWELPVPATYVIAPDGRIVLASIEVDYRTRLEPDAIIAAVKSLRPV
ncbi:peroxiredoxin-like family protein [Paraburkholderia caribensis]|uniref:peroxiredoxin-like family protein n=1 Tax=Paraburkholderia TaxID=1822464 RepID=UPI001CB13A42|nr:peroxiredoxin-like family protein [Paraburkholderia caribensis]BEU25733.1 peroxiredoxin-like family protein [Paraburkholderia sp. 22B1P]CAG9249594.1 AhpC/Tsa family protein / selenocysteine-containing [Paraburkholderia caribensis]